MSAASKIQWTDATDGERAVLGAIGRVFRMDEDGRFWRIKGGRRAENRTGFGYLQLRLMVGGVRHHVGAHRIAWMLANGRALTAGSVVNHINGVKDDNRPSNLEACSTSENAKHAYRIGLRDEHGERNPAAKLSDSAVEAIRTEYERGGVTQSALGARYGISFKTVSKIVRGDRRRNQSGKIDDYVRRRSSSVRLLDRKGGDPSEWPEDLRVREFPR